MINRLIDLLVQVRLLAGRDFAGIGLIVHRVGVTLPVFPLRDGIVLPQASSLEITLARIASNSSDLHDGFHLVSTDWELTAVAQYFSPPIIADAKINRSRIFGGRYIAAQFGSAVPGIELCGIATSTLGVAVFHNCAEVHFQTL